MTIQGVYLVPEVTTRIMSQQYLAQQAQDHSLKLEGRGTITTSKSISLFWHERSYHKTGQLEPKLYVGMTTTAPGSKTYK